MSVPETAFLDTSVIVRYLTDDPPALAARAAQIIDSEQTLIVSELVLVETAYVLASVYQTPRAAIVDALSLLVQKANLRLFTLPKPLALEALHLCRNSQRYSFTDAFLWAFARHAGIPHIYTFDGRFPSDAILLYA